VLVTNDERSAIAITAYRLDVHLIPVTARQEVHADLTLRNTSSTPMARIPLQLSSTLRWQTASEATPHGLQALPMTQSPIATDADHTGYAQEAVFTPATPLAPGAEMTISVFYSGTIRQSAARLELIGAPPDKANASDWDAIVPTTDAATTALRGFGDVFWYPVAAPTAAFGDTNRLFELIRQQRRRDIDTTIALRLTVDYVGDPPNGVIFDSELKPLTKAPDTQDEVVEQTHGIATAEFTARPMGFRAASLFLTAQDVTATDGQTLTIITPNPERGGPYLAAAAPIAAQLKAWLGDGPNTPLLLLDHAGDPFEDGTLLVGRLSANAKAENVAPELVRGLTHAWFDPPAPAQIPADNLWLSQGLAELMAVIATENLLGRDKAIEQLQQAYVLLALSEPAATGVSSSKTGTTATAPAQGPIAPQPLTEAYSDAFLRFKSLAVLWQLREQLGEDLLRRCLSDYRKSVVAAPALPADAKGFEHSVEKTSNRDLAGFFDDWVYQDRGLPDLTLGFVEAHALPARAGKNGGYLVAVEIKNDGGAVADVPVIVTSDVSSVTERVKVAAHASASIRIVFEGIPTQVQVNDGSVPEVGALVHTAQVHTQEK
jgi:hypothetical protein